MSAPVDASVSDTVAAVRAALENVIDPCALVNGTKLSLIDLGMIDNIVVHDDAIRIELMLDDPLCLYMGAIHQEIRDRIADIIPDRRVEITIRGDVIWTVEHATPETRSKIADWQAKRRERLSRRPVPVAPPIVRPAAEE